MLNSRLGFENEIRSVGGLWLSHLAWERADMYKMFVTVSPGGTLDTDAMHDAVQPLRALDLASSPIPGREVCSVWWAPSTRWESAPNDTYVAALTEDGFPLFPRCAWHGAGISPRRRRCFRFRISHWCGGVLTDQKDITVYPTGMLHSRRGGGRESRPCQGAASRAARASKAKEVE